VIAESPDALRERGIVSHHRTGISKSAKVLAWIEAEAAHVRKAAGSPPSPCRTMRLGSIFHYRKAGGSRNLSDRVHIDRLSVKVNNDDRSGPMGDCISYASGGHQQSCRINVDENRRGLDREHRFRGSEKGVGRNDYLVSLSNA
jgi:hypothetical protein